MEFGDATRRLMMCAVLTLVSTSIATPVHAEDVTTRWFDAISGLFAQPEDKRVTVPKRRNSAGPTPAAPDGEEAAQGTPVTVPKRRNSTGPTPAAPDGEEAAQRTPVADIAEGALGVPDGGAVEQETPADALARRAAAERPAAPVSGDVTGESDGTPPSPALHAVESLIVEIQSIRWASGIDDFPPEADLKEGRAPIHVFAKSLEVLGKVVNVQRRMKIPEGTVGRIPLRNIGAADVLSSVERILIEVRRIGAQMGIDRPVAPQTSGRADASPMIYKRLGDASFMLDGLRGGPLNSDDVHAMALSVLDEMVLVADHLGTSLDLDPTPITGVRYPLDVAVEVARAAYKLAGLQSMLQMDASGVPTPDLARVTPSTNYDATNMLLAEMTRIKLHLGIDAVRDELRDKPTGTKPKHNAALIMLIARNLDRMVLAVSG